MVAVARRAAGFAGPPFVFGHSMGALIALELAIEEGRRGAEGDAAPLGGAGPAAGWISSGAGIRPAGIARPHLVFLARLLSRVTPRLSLDLGIEAEALSRDPAVIEAYRRDPLVRKRATVRWGAEALAAIDRIVEGASAIEGPLLVLHGADDPLAEAEGSRWLASAVGPNAELRVYPEVLHEPHNDPGPGDPLDDLVDWIDRGIQDRGGRGDGGPRVPEGEMR